MIAGLTTEARICGLRAWIVRALKVQTSIEARTSRFFLFACSTRERNQHEGKYLDR